MYPQTHFLVPFALAEILVKLGLFNHKLALIAGVVGVIIDLDHYLHRIIIHHDFSVKSAWNKAILQHDIHGERTFIHHWSGLVAVTIILLALFFLSWHVSVALFLGYYSHLFLDGLHLHIKKRWKFKEGGLIFKIPVYEIILDIILVLILFFFDNFSI